VTTNKELSVLMKNHLPLADDIHQGLVVIAGNSFSLSCSSPEKFLHWSYCRLGNRTLKIIYDGKKFSPDFSHPSINMSITKCDDRTCTLNIDALGLGDAGFFACKRDTVIYYWSITVLGKYNWSQLAACEVCFYIY